jgi:soluble lytic murein transglycosylase-like protein
MLLRTLSLLGLLLAGCAPAPQPVAAAASVPAPALTVRPASVPAPVPVPDPPPKAVSAAKPVAAPPRAALAYRDELIRTARAVWGLNAPVAVFGAQIHQESGWRHDAVSPVGALGLAQFMPATAKWIAQIDPALVEGQPYNPGWAMRAMVTYDQHLYAQAPARYSPRERMWVALRGYNGGIEHWNNEAKATGLPQPTRAQVDAACGKARRSARHCPENLGYPKRILIDIQPRYADWGAAL